MNEASETWASWLGSNYVYYVLHKNQLGHHRTSMRLWTLEGPRQRRCTAMHMLFLFQTVRVRAQPRPITAILAAMYTFWPPSAARLIWLAVWHFALLQVIVSALTTFLTTALFDALDSEKIFIFFYCNRSAVTVPRYLYSAH